MRDGKGALGHVIHLCLGHRGIDAQLLGPFQEPAPLIFRRGLRVSARVPPVFPARKPPGAANGTGLGLCAWLLVDFPRMEVMDSTRQSNALVGTSVASFAAGALVVYLLSSRRRRCG